MVNIKNLFRKKGKKLPSAFSNIRNFNNNGNLDEKVKYHKKKKRIKIAAVLAFIAIAAFGYKLYYNNKVYTDYTVKEKTKTEKKSNSHYAKFSDYLIKYNNDGISYFTPKGQVWNQAFEMKKPVVDVCGSYAAIGEQRSNKIFVFDETGSKGQMETSYPIVKVEVANQGVVAALLEDKDANYIEVRDKDGSQLITGKTVLDGNGYPIDFSLSEDGTKMVVSYLCITGGQVQTKVLFYNFSEIGKNEVDRMVGGFNHYKTTIVPQVEFVTNDIAIAFGDNIFTIYSMSQKPEIVAEQKFSDEVKKVFFSDKYIGVVYYNSKKDEPFELIVYSLNGKKEFSYTYTKEYNNVKFTGEDILFFDDLECKVVSLSGKVKFESTFAEEVIDMFPTKSRYTYLLIFNDSVQKIKLK